VEAEVHHQMEAGVGVEQPLPVEVVALVQQEGELGQQLVQ